MENGALNGITTGERTRTRASSPTSAPQSREAAMAGLKKVADQFESLFVQTLMKSMRQTVPTSELTGGGGEMDTYKQMLDQALADRIGGQGGLGIADMVTRQYMPYVSGEGLPDTSIPLGPAPLPDASGRTYSPVPETSARRTPPELQRALAAYAEEGAGKKSLAERADELGGAAADTLRRWGPEIETAAREHDLAPELMLAVIVQESGGRADAVSRVGAQGLMQLMPATAAQMGVDDPFDPAENIHGGARYLAHLRGIFGDDLDLVLAAYNAGPGNVKRAGNEVPVFTETRNYVEKVGTLYGDLNGTTTLGYTP